MLARSTESVRLVETLHYALMRATSADCVGLIRRSRFSLDPRSRLAKPSKLSRHFSSAMQSLRLRRRLKTHYSIYICDAPDRYGKDEGKSEGDQSASDGFDGDGARSPEAVEGGGKGAFVVGFSTPSDPLNPQVRNKIRACTGVLALTQTLRVRQDWPIRTRLFATSLLALLVLFVGSASSMNAFVANKLAADLGVSETIVRSRLLLRTKMSD